MINISKFFYISLFFFLLTTSNLHATKIATINIDLIINNSVLYKSFLTDLDSFKKKITKEFQTKEKALLNEKKDIENSQILLSPEEIQKKINIYQLKIEKFESEVNQKNIIFKKNIEINRSNIMNEIIKLTTKLAKEKKIDIILTEEMYFLSSDDIDFSDQIIEIINNTELSFKVYENFK